ncbi:MarR family transcriptional regulator [Cryobacterium sp. PH29-G1]|uniref:MarR family winged helix-turn-helix transcriptional regulator n=1 Tax=Cryobacterium sp. PH29-G1 TaxID=3046211 RepID=UPI0024B9B3A4|nr:MarR family transcriptional regulator [Cryobacterium sp. PH29-G1]MDJ0351011.1 MarR family transcriptional regulator [Cryobacterium sp. PH29-G1]
MTKSVPAVKAPLVSRAEGAAGAPAEFVGTGAGAGAGPGAGTGTGTGTGTSTGTSTGAGPGPGPGEQTRAADPAADRLRDSDRLRDTDLANEIEFMTARARSVGSARANSMLAELDLRVRSYSVLSLACSGQNPSQRELAGFLSLDPSQIVALVDHLEQLGAVTREQDPRDRRSKVIVATPAGRELYRQAGAMIQAAEDRSLRGLSSAERDQLRSLLRRIAFEPAP